MDRKRTRSTDLKQALYCEDSATFHRADRISLSSRGDERRLRQTVNLRKMIVISFLLSLLVKGTMQGARVHYVR